LEWEFHDDDLRDKNPATTALNHLFRSGKDNFSFPAGLLVNDFPLVLRLIVHLKIR
jgi:hypothetical protein